MARKQQPLPPALLYALLKALGPARIAMGRPKVEAGSKVDKVARQAFQALVDAASRAKTADQFKKRIADSATTDALGSHGAITELTVEYTKSGYTIIRVRFEDGTQYVVAYPTT